MYSGSLKKIPFQPDESVFRHAGEREEEIRLLRAASVKERRREERELERRGKALGVPCDSARPEASARPVEAADRARPLPSADLARPESLARLLEQLSPEDSALVALIVFLLCDNSENDVVLLGILLYVLLSK